VTTRNSSAERAELAELQARVDLLDWLQAEQQHRTMNLASALAVLLTQASQPQVQQSILDQLMGSR
jgi:hypothetical protein